jgi:hypothetical protein
MEPKKVNMQNVFLHGILEEEVYMHQSPGYEDKKNPGHVCKLDKAIYGLKQAPMASYSRLSSKFEKLGFVPSNGDTSLFYFRSKGITMYILVYVDDIIIASSSSKVTSALLKSLEEDFVLKDLGDLHYFCNTPIAK